MIENYFVGCYEYFIRVKSGVYYVVDDCGDIYYHGTYNQCLRWLDSIYVENMQELAY